MAQGRGNALGLVLVASFLAFSHTAVGVDHNIGGTNNWDYPPGMDTNYYETWSAKQNFVEGDNLVFTYQAEMHDVVIVTASQYTNCVVSTGQKFRTGKDKIPLPKAGKYYFYCSIPSHCDTGMKVMVDVKAAATAPPLGSTTPPTQAPSSRAPALAPALPLAPSTPAPLPSTRAPAPAPELPPAPSTATFVSSNLRLIVVMAASAFCLLFLC